MGIREVMTRKLLTGARETVLAEEGTFFVASNPTPGTGIAGQPSQASFDETKPLMIVYNGGNYSIYPLYLRLTCTAASTGNTVQRFTQTIDTGNKKSAGGTLLTAVNTNMGSSVASSAVVTFGAPTASAAGGSRRILSTQTYRTALGVVGDVYQFSWGHEQGNDPASLITSGTAIANVSFSFAPVVIGPNQSFLINQWAASQVGAASYEVEFGYTER
jgi:hypothetical protein